MRLNTGGTRSGQARNAQQLRQFPKLALAALFVLAACGQSKAAGQAKTLGEGRPGALAFRAVKPERTPQACPSSPFRGALRHLGLKDLHLRVGAIRQGAKV